MDWIALGENLIVIFGSILVWYCISGLFHMFLYMINSWEKIVYKIKRPNHLIWSFLILKVERQTKIRKSRLGKKPTNRISISINNRIYESYNDASKELGIPVVTIRWRCLSNNIKFVDYKLV